MKYCQSGGGKMDKEFKSTYYKHCQQIMVDNNIRSKIFLIQALQDDVYTAIETIEEYAPFKAILEESVSIIFSSTNFSDPNSI